MNICKNFIFTANNRYHSQHPASQIRKCVPNVVQCVCCCNEIARKERDSTVSPTEFKCFKNPSMDFAWSTSGNLKNWVQLELNNCSVSETHFSLFDVISTWPMLSRFHDFYSKFETHVSQCLSLILSNFVWRKLGKCITKRIIDTDSL